MAFPLNDGTLPVFSTAERHCTRLWHAVTQQPTKPALSLRCFVHTKESDGRSMLLGEVSVRAVPRGRRGGRH